MKIEQGGREKCTTHLQSTRVEKLGRMYVKADKLFQIHSEIIPKYWKQENEIIPEYLK